MIKLATHPQGVVIGVKVQPSARRNAIIAERAGALRIAVTAAPERGKANEAVLRVLAGALDVKPSQLAILTGETSRDKRVLIAGVDPKVVAAIVARIVGAM